MPSANYSICRAYSLLNNVAKPMSLATLGPVHYTSAVTLNSLLPARSRRGSKNLPHVTQK